MFVATLLSLGIALVSGYLLFATTMHRNSRVLDLIFGLAVAVFIVSVVSLITGRISRLLHDDKTPDEPMDRDRGD